ncbi:MAG TPA: protein-glutamate O-methyltransferase CheR [Symbiobacteriaceae bacterium]
MNLPGYPLFRKRLLELTGIDLDCYKGTQMERRLQTIMRRAGVPDLTTYAHLLTENPAKLKEFQDFLTINVSEWLRNPEKFEELQRVILPELLRRRNSLRIWSAGCANGAEPYSVAMLLDELDPRECHQILATDIDAEILKVAMEGVYTEKDMKNVSPERRRRYFIQEGDRYRVIPALRRRVQFKRHNLLADPFPSEIDLLLCRNVVIYFTEAAKEELYRRFHKALSPGGILFVGSTESLLRPQEFGFVSVSPFFYRAVK